MDPITMMVASIGMQFFNNYANNEKNDEMRASVRCIDSSVAFQS